MTELKSPIVTVAGHVDHGKTTLLDRLRGGTLIAEKEAGRITQKISFSMISREHVKQMCPLLDLNKIPLQLPGFLFIDTPGHAAFSNLRKRGGSLADLSILVVDINEGIKPQTAEVIQIMKLNKVPFIIALNKIDNISGWKNRSSNLRQSIEQQAINTKQNFDEKLLTFIGSLSLRGFESDVFYEVADFSKKIAIVPCSAKTGEGLPELLLVLCGLCQKYLHDRLVLGEEAKGVILEIKKEKATELLEAVLYDGKLSDGDEIAIASFGEPVVTKIRALEEITPMSSKFKQARHVHAASGIRMQLVDKPDILPGMPFVVVKDNLDEIKSSFRKEISSAIQCDKHGIIIKADSLGSLEALFILLKQENIPISRADIGRINKTDLLRAKACAEMNPLDGIILGFNVSVDDEAKEFLQSTKVITGEVVYKILDDFKLFRDSKAKEIEKSRMMELAHLCKVKVLSQHVFRNSNPAVFGAEIVAGKLVSGLPLINQNGEKVGRVKAIQSDNKSVQEAPEGMQVAISIPGMNFERQMKDVQFLYADISETQCKTFKKNKDLLTSGELRILDEIASLKRKIGKW